MLYLVSRGKYTLTRYTCAWYAIFFCTLLTSMPTSAKGSFSETPDSTENIRRLNIEKNDATKPFYSSIKTNLLYDALAVPNIAAEFYLGRGFSIGGEWMYAWWSRESRHKMWRIYGGELSGRYWFGPAAKRKPLTGHHAGIYAGMMTFCFEFGAKGYMGGRPGQNLWDRAWITAGIEYGYSLPVASRLNIDFTIGIGYLGGIMEKYTTEGDRHVWKSTVRQTWIGPTKAEITLVWLLGRGNRNISRRNAEASKVSINKTAGL